MGILFCHLRIIYPACAGVNLAVARCQKVYFYFPRMRGVNPAPPVLSKGISDSPRMRGGHPFARVALRASLFTPHARGSTLFIDWPFDGVSIHPACAGVNPPTDRLLCSYAHSPRMRGGQPDLIVDAYTTLEFPPAYAGM